MLIFLYGNDVFRSTEKLNVLKENFINKNTSNVNSSVFDFKEDASFEKLQSMLKAGGLFSSEKIVIIKNAIDSADKLTQDKIFNYLDEGEVSSDTLLILWEKNEPRKNNKLFKLLINKFKSEKFDKLSGVKLASWIKKEFEKRKATIDNQALNKLINFVGDDLSQMRNEIDKLANFSNGKPIIEEDVGLIVKSKIEANIFETIEAIGAKNKSRALKLLHDQIEQGDDPFYILSMYIYQFRNLLKIGSFYFNGINDKNIIAKETKLHPFVVQKGTEQLINFSFDKLKLIYKNFEEVDIKVKTGKAGIEDALDRLIIKI